MKEIWWFWRLRAAVRKVWLSLHFIWDMNYNTRSLYPHYFLWTKKYRLMIFFLWLNLGFSDFHLWKHLKLIKLHSTRLCIKSLQKSIPFTSHYILMHIFFSNAYFLKFKILCMGKAHIVLYTKCIFFYKGSYKKYFRICRLHGLCQLFTSATKRQKLP